MARVTLNRIHVAIMLYIVLIALLIIIKPAMMFMANGDPKQWGTENTETTSVFAPAVMFPGLALVCYYIAVWFDIVMY